MHLLHHNSDTGELSVFSSTDGSTLLELENIDIPTAHKIDRAIRTAEEKAARKAQTTISLQILEFAQGLTY